MADSKIGKLSVDLLVTNAGTQMRAKVDDDAVERYADLWRARHDFPPLEVFDDGERKILADGFHRLYGAKAAKRSSVPCRIHKGTLKDAILFACGANHDHGLHRTNADKACAIDALLDNPEWCKRSARWIAEQCRVNDKTVAKRIADRKPSVLDTPKSGNRTAEIRSSIESKDGKTRPAAKQIVNDPAEPQPKPTASGKDGSPGKKPQEPPPEPSRRDTDKPGDFGTCPNCGGRKWTEDEFGATCAKCNHPHGEPVGDQDEDRIVVQRSKTVKTVEALMRAFDDLNRVLTKPEHVEAIASCKFLLKTARAWK